MVDEVRGEFAKIKQQGRLDGIIGGKLELLELFLKNCSIEKLAQTTGVAISEIENLLNSKY